MMSQRDYKKIAATFRKMRPMVTDPELQEILLREWKRNCQIMADYLSGDNWRFKREMFMDACGVNDEDQA